MNVIHFLCASTSAHIFCMLKKCERYSTCECRRQKHWGETGLANAGVSLSKMDAPKVVKSVFCSFEVL